MVPKIRTVELLKLATAMKEQNTAAGGVKRRKYDASFKQEVLQMIYNGRPLSEVAQSLGIGENIIYRWKSTARQQQQLKGQPVADSSRRRDAHFTQTYPATGAGKRYFKKSFSHFQPPDLKSRYGFIELHAAQYPVEVLCQVLRVSRSAYYSWKQQQQQATGADKKQIEQQV